MKNNPKLYGCLHDFGLQNLLNSDGLFDTVCNL